MALRLAVAAGLLALALAVPASARDLAAIRRDGILRVLLVPDDREREFVDMDSRERPGFDLEILQGFAHAQRLHLDVVPLAGWDQLVPALLKQQGDLIAGRFTDTEARRQQIQFTQPVFPTGVVVVTRKPHAAVTTLAALRSETKVGTVRGTSMDEALAGAGFRGKVDYATLEQKGLTEALRSGAIRAAVWGLEGAVAALNHDSDLQIGLRLGAPASLAYGVRQEDGDLRAALDEHLTMLRETGAWQRLVVRYLGASAPQILKRASEGAPK